MLYATPFYNSKIFIPNGSASSFGEDDFSSGEAGQSLKTVVKHLKPVAKHLEALRSGLYLGGQRRDRQRLSKADYLSSMRDVTP